MRLRALLVVIWFLPLLPLSPAKAAEINKDDALIAMGYCKQIEGYVNALVDYTLTTCLPSQGDRGKSFIFISSKPVLSVEASKKAWMIGIVGAFGKTFNERPSYKTDTIYFSDVNNAKNRKYKSLDAAIGKDLQKKAYDGQITLETMWSRMTAAMKEVQPPAK